MARYERITDFSCIKDLLISEEFRKYIMSNQLTEDTYQTNINLANAINLLGLGSAVARPLMTKVLTTEGLFDPEKDIAIEFNNKFYNISKKKFEADKLRDITQIVEDLEDECLIPRISLSPTNEMYTIRDEIRKMITVR